MILANRQFRLPNDNGWPTILELSDFGLHCGVAEDLFARSRGVDTSSTDGRLCERLNLPQQGSKVKVNPSRRNRSGFEVTFVKRAARNLNLPLRCLDVAEGALT